jgi:hypothetical protein
MKTYFLAVSILLIINTVKAQNTIVLEENFDSQNAISDWKTHDDATGKTWVANGKLYIERYNDDAGKISYVNKFIEIDETDVEIEVTLKQISGQYNSSMGIAFGVGDTQNFYNFCITSTQYYKVG